MPDSPGREQRVGRRDALLSLDELQTVVHLLDEAGIAWAVVGGQVANLYRSDIRLTRDYDLLVDTFDGLRAALTSAGFEIEIGGSSDSEEAWFIRAVCHDIPYDFLLAEVDYQVEAIDRAQANGGVLTVEDVLVQKLLAWRPDDQRDVESILATQMSFDLRLVRRWCEAFEIADRLDDALCRVSDEEISRPDG
ncbi:MAG: hypothetical protein HZB14_04420 [Actinobacteria bacterium]|nr:hypothetical protein [Actinomycetota bacterium]